MNKKKASSPLSRILSDHMCLTEENMNGNYQKIPMFFLTQDLTRRGMIFPRITEVILWTLIFPPTSWLFACFRSLWHVIWMSRRKWIITWLDLHHGLKWSNQIWLTCLFIEECSCLYNATLFQSSVRRKSCYWIFVSRQAVRWLMQLGH